VHFLSRTWLIYVQDSTPDGQISLLLHTHQMNCNIFNRDFIVKEVSHLSVLNSQSLGFFCILLQTQGTVPLSNYISACFISKSTKRISMKYCTGGWLHYKLSSEFNFGFYWSSITSTLYEAKIKLYHFPKTMKKKKTGT
jgi:hypothetical protein